MARSDSPAVARPDIARIEALAGRIQRFWDVDAPPGEQDWCCWDLVGELTGLCRAIRPVSDSTKEG